MRKNALVIGDEQEYWLVTAVITVSSIGDTTFEGPLFRGCAALRHGVLTESTERSTSALDALHFCSAST